MTELIKCATCQGNIAPTATTCPHCGARTGTSSGDWAGIILVGSISLMVLCFMLGGC